MILRNLVGMLALAAITSCSANAGEGNKLYPPAQGDRTKQGTLDDWQRDRFGVFIHWGPSSILEVGGGSWFRDNIKTPPQENQTKAETPEVITSGEYMKYKGTRPVPQEAYDNLHHVFNPSGFDASEWAKLFKEAGAGYIVFTAKHHDGFCMYDTKTQDYDIMNTPFKRDICKELADACRAEGVRVFWYYSPVDWWHTEWISHQDTSYEETHFLPQVEELVTKYGPIEGIWWDGNQITEKYAQKTVDLIAKHQPWALLNPRLGGGVEGDFNTPEQTMGEFNMDRRWESCFTMTGSHWFWNGGKDYKPTSLCIRTLIQCACGDGNLLLDVGPRPDGRIDERAAATYREIGQWLKTNGHTIRGTRGGPYKPGPWGGSTRSGKHVYLHVTQRIEDGILRLPALPVKIEKAQYADGTELDFEQTDSGLVLNMTMQNPVDTIVDLTLESDAMDIQPIDADAGESLTLDAVGTSSSLGGRGSNASSLVHHSWEHKGKTLQFGEPGYDEQQEALKHKPEKKEPGFGWANNHHGHPFRFWQAKEDDKQPWVELELKGESTFSQVYLWENFGYIKSFKMDAYINGQWKTLFSEPNVMGIYNRKLKQPVTATKVRVRFMEINGPVSMNGIMLYP